MKTMREDSYMLFSAGTRYGITLQAITGVMEWQPCLGVRNVPDHICGVSYLRGEIYTLLDMKKRSGGGAILHPAHIILLKERDLHIGLVAEAIHGMRSASDDKTDFIPLRDSAATMLQPLTPDGTGTAHD